MKLFILSLSLLTTTFTLAQKKPVRKPLYRDSSYIKIDSDTTFGVVEYYSPYDTFLKKSDGFIVEERSWAMIEVVEPKPKIHYTIYNKDTVGMSMPGATGTLQGRWKSLFIKIGGRIIELDEKKFYKFYEYQRLD